MGFRSNVSTSSKVKGPDPSFPWVSAGFPSKSSRSANIAVEWYLPRTYFQVIGIRRQRVQLKDFANFSLPASSRLRKSPELGD